MAYTWYTKGSGLDFDIHENYVDYTDKIHSQTGVAFNCGSPNVVKNIDNLTDFYIGFTVYYAQEKPGPYGTWNWLNVIGNGTDYFINGSDNYLCCMPDSNGYKPPYKKGLSHIIVHVDTVNDKIEYWYNLQKVYTRESAGIAGKSYTAINMFPTGGGTNYAQCDNAISDIIITTEKTDLDKYISKFFQPVSINFDGSTNYAEIPVSLTDTANWSAEITFTTTENGSDNRVYHQPCLFGYDTANSLSRDFHVDTSGGNLYVFNGLGNSSKPVGGTASSDNGDYGVNTGIKVNDGKKHTAKIVSTTSKIEVYCDGTLATTIYPTTTLSADAFYIGCSKPGESVFGQLTLYSFKLTKNGALVASYQPTIKEALTGTLTDNSGNGNNATLYGNTYEYAVVTEDIDFSLSADTSRAVQTIATVNADTNRAIAAHLEAFDISADMERAVYRTELIKTDTNRTVQAIMTVEADAARKTVLPFEIDADTQRRFGVSTPFSFGADTSLTVERTEKINAESSRRVEKTIAINVDATRDVQAPFSIAVDTTRNLQNNISLSVDTSRTVERIESVNGDSIRYLVFDMDKLLIPANQPPAQGEFTPFPANPPKAATKGIISMSLELATGTLSDTLNLETFGTDFTPKRAIRGTFLDFPYEYLVEQVTSIGKRQTVTCMNQIDQKKYAKVDTGDLLSSAVDVAKKIADSLGMKLETYHEKFTVTTSYSTTRVTASNMMSGLYSWTQNLPWRKINVFFRDKTMYVVQRGYEPREPYDITALHYPEPTITQAVYRNQYSENNKQTKVGKNVKTKGFSGAIVYPNGGYTNYDDGKPTDSVKYQNGLKTETWWNYDNFGRMTHQIVDTEPSGDFALNPANENANDTHSEIRIEYYGEGPNGSYEVSKTTTVTEETDRKTGKTTKTTTVNYSESAPGSTSSTTINSDGGVASATGSTLLQTNSDFARNQYNTVSCGGKPEWIVEGGGVFDENTITDFPLNDTDGGLTLGEIAAELNAYDRCIQETLQIELVEPVVDGKPTMTHIVDFLERVKFRGNEYYLERNEIERTTREIKQTITAVRWEGNLSAIEKGGGTP